MKKQACNRYDSEHWWLKEDNVPVTVSAGGFVTEVQALTPFVENRDPNNMNEYLQVRFGINVQDYIYIFTPVSAELFQSQIGCLKKVTAVPRYVIFMAFTCTPERSLLTLLSENLTRLGGFG